MSLAGRERRFPQQLCFKKVVNTGWNPVNFVFLLGTLIILGTSSFVIVSYMRSSISSIISFSTVHPTSIPWINNKSDCEHTRRTWRDEKCWDYEHNPMF